MALAAASARTRRPSELCPGGVCAERARSRRRQAAGLLESAERQAELAEQTRQGKGDDVRNAAYLDSRATVLREQAAELIKGPTVTEFFPFGLSLCSGPVRT